MSAESNSGIPLSRADQREIVMDAIVHTIHEQGAESLVADPDMASSINGMLHSVRQPVTTDQARLREENSNAMISHLAEVRGISKQEAGIFIADSLAGLIIEVKGKE